MTREEALEFLADEMAILEAQNLGPPEWRAQFREAVAALEAMPPCACGNRKPLAVKPGQLVYGGKGIGWALHTGLLFGQSCSHLDTTKDIRVKIIILEEAA